jgi:transcriptional regulator with XRE-family HTH domain
MIYPMDISAGSVGPVEIGAVVRELRSARRMTQTELARVLGIAQGRLSDLERGKASFSAEQFLLLLRLFNVPASRFAGAPSSQELDLQNAVSRLGARHLVEHESVVPSERLRDVYRVVLEVLADPESPRLVTGLAPVLVENVDSLNFAKLALELRDVGLERRLFWLIDNVRDAVDRELSESPPASRARTLRRARVALGRASTMPLARTQDLSAVDLLDRTVRSEESVRELEAEASPASRRWNVTTALKPHDFYDALKQASRAPV